MPRMSKKRKEEWAFFLNDRRRIAYNAPYRDWTIAFVKENERRNGCSS